MENQPEDLLHEALVQAVVEALSAHTDGMLSCTRVWSAWGCGTMSEEDFVPISDDATVLRDIAQCVATHWRNWNQTGLNDVERIRDGLTDGLGQTLVHQSGWPCAPDEFNEDAFSEVAGSAEQIEPLVAPLLAACRAVAAQQKVVSGRPRPRPRS